MVHAEIRKTNTAAGRTQNRKYVAHNSTHCREEGNDAKARSRTSSRNGPTLSVNTKQDIAHTISNAVGYL